MKRYMTGLALALAALASAAAEQKSPRVVDEGGIRDTWMLAQGTQLASPALPRAATQGARNVCIALAYTIGPDGTTSAFRVLKQWNSETGEGDEPFDGFWIDYASAGAFAVRQWKFAPRPDATPAATTTVATLTWQAQPNTDRDALRARCRIDGLAAYLARERRGSLTNHQVDLDNRTRDRVMRKQAGTPRQKPTARQ